MTDELLRQALVVLQKHEQGSDEGELAEYVLVTRMSSAQREVLSQLVTAGPIWDGDIVSKAARDDLLVWGLASRACIKGEQGYTVANYRGWDVWHALPPAPVEVKEPGTVLHRFHVKMPDDLKL